MTSLLIDCGRCPVRGSGCSDCVVTAVFGSVPEGLSPSGESDGTGFGGFGGDDVSRAIAVLAAAGMLAPVRAVAHPNAPSAAVA